MKIRAKRKIRNLINEELGEEFLEDFLPRKEEVKVELKEEKRYENELMEKDMELLDSSVLPERYLIKVEKLVKNTVEFPSVDGKPVKISYLVDTILKTTNYDFGLLRNLIDSKFSSEIFFKNLGIEESPKARWFLEKCLYSSNSRDSLALFMGYELLLPGKISKVEEAGVDNERKIFNVYTQDFRGIDSKIIGVGVSLLKHLRIRGIIKPCYH
ncbi:MAG: hypothetical protein QXP77_02710 [Candidatus Aenigmatarchaeota archaeon]